MSVSPQSPLGVVQAVLSASEERNADAYLVHYLENAVMRRADGVVLAGKDAIARNFADYVASGRTRHVDILDSLSLIRDDTALVCTRYRMTFTGGAPSEPIHGTSHDVLERQEDGSWLLSIDHPYEPSVPRDGERPSRRAELDDAQEQQGRKSSGTYER